MEQKEVGGRPSKFTPERCKSILQSIADRIPYELAAEANGICEDTLYEWLKIGRNDLRKGLDTDYSKFSESIKQVEQKRIKEHMDCINSAPERWQAQAWLLERRWWKYFSPNAAIVEFNKKLSRMEDEDKNGDQPNAKTYQRVTKEDFKE